MRLLLTALLLLAAACSTGDHESYQKAGCNPPISAPSATPDAGPTLDADCRHCDDGTPDPEEGPPWCQDDRCFLQPRPAPVIEEIKVP